MNIAEFKAAVKADREALKNNQLPAGMFACTDCGTPLQEAFTGNRELADGSHVCSDCYFEAFGRELDAHPIAALRLRQFR